MKIERFEDIGQQLARNLRRFRDQAGSIRIMG